MSPAPACWSGTVCPSHPHHPPNPSEVTTKSHLQNFLKNLSVGLDNIQSFAVVLIFPAFQHAVGAPNRQVPYSFIPMKNCRYGFSPTSFTSHSSLHFSRRSISSAPSAIRAGCAGWPLFANWAAHRSSSTPQGTSAASATQYGSGAFFP